MEQNRELYVIITLLWLHMAVGWRSAI